MKHRPRFTALPSFAPARWMRLACLLAVALPVVASAQVVFTVHAKVLFGGSGYTSNQMVDFSFMLNNYAPATPVGEVQASPADAAWEENTTSDPLLWSSVAGTGITGTWQRPATQPTAPASSIQLLAEHGGTSFSVTAATDTSPGTDTGLVVNGQGMAVLGFSATFEGLAFEIPGATPLPDPATTLDAPSLHERQSFHILSQTRFSP